ncbi:MAG: GHMP kinase [Dehalococcoidia bacterium]|nr:MAG: GHMP kinase [Dehalococcoidia bacterium]
MVEGVHLHVSAPIDRFAQAAFLPLPLPLSGPPDRPKALAAVARLLEEQGLPRQGRLWIWSSLPRGKGLGSSTADIGAALFATATAHGVVLSSLAAARLALRVEPTDGSLFPGLVVFDHREGRWLELLGPPPPVACVVLDPGGTVDTLAFNARDQRAHLRANEPLIREALAMVRAACREGDVTLLGAAATLSAQAHQAVLEKPLLPLALARAREAGAAGVAVAHSGTVIVALFDRRRADVAAAARWLARQLGCPAWVATLISGGPRFERAWLAGIAAGLVS